MTRYLVSAGIGFVVAIAIFYAGVRYERNAQAARAIAQLQDDAKAVKAIEKKDHEKQIKILERIRIVKESVPSQDCFNMAMPAAAIDGLRNAGIAARSAPNR